MKVQRQIDAKVGAALAPSHLEVINESHMHNLPPGSETHFRLVIVSDRFDGKSPLDRHREVNRILAAELEGAIHALALRTFTVAEWAQSPAAGPSSPPCPRRDRD